MTENWNSVNEVVIARYFRYSDQATGSIHVTPRNALKYEDGVKVVNKLLHNYSSVETIL